MRTRSSVDEAVAELRTRVSKLPTVVDNLEETEARQEIFNSQIDALKSAQTLLQSDAAGKKNNAEALAEVKRLLDGLAQEASVAGHGFK